MNADRAHPIAWLGLEHTKGPGRCPPGHSLLIAQMAPVWSQERWDAPADAIGPEVAGMVSALLGEELRALMGSAEMRRVPVGGSFTFQMWLSRLSVRLPGSTRPSAGK